MDIAQSAAKPSKFDVRSEVVRTLIAWEATHGSLDQISRPFLRKIPEKFRPLYTELSRGVMRNLSFLDYKLEKILDTPLPKLPSPIRNLLRLGGYQLEFSSLPKPVLVSIAVELAKSFGHEGTVRLVNGVLRTWASGISISLPSDPAESLAISYSHPTWLVRRWLEKFGEEKTRQLLAWNNTPPAVSISINSLRIQREEFQLILKDQGISFQVSPFPETLVLPPSQSFEKEMERPPKPRSIEKMPGYREGFFLVQSPASLLPVYLLSPEPGETIVDLCAAPGGKSCQMAIRMENQGKIISVDSDSERLKLVEENRRRLGLSIITPTPADGREFGRAFPESADRVLLDAPCSASGVFQRRADARWNRTPRDLQRFPKLQGELLESAASLLKPGGILIYSTCSLEPEENEEVVTAFLKNRPEFFLEEPTAFLPKELQKKFPKKEGALLRILPQEHGLDGFFAARFQRKR